MGLRDQNGQTDTSSQTRLNSNRQADERRSHSRCSDTKRHTHGREGKGEDRKVPGSEVRNTDNVEHQSLGSTISNRSSRSNQQQSGETPAGDPWQKQDPQVAKTAILGSAHILRKVLDLLESG